MKIQAHDISGDGETPTYTLAQLTIDEFYIFWPFIERELDKIPHTWKMWTKEYIQSAVEMGSLVVWAAGPPPDAVFVFFTQVSMYPAGRVLTVPLGFGRFDKHMLPLLDATITKYAQLQDCVSIEIRGRAGWGVHFKPLGFKQDYVTLARPVPQLRMQ